MESKAKCCFIPCKGGAKVAMWTQCYTYVTPENIITAENQTINSRYLYPEPHLKILKSIKGDEIKNYLILFM